MIGAKQNTPALWRPVLIYIGPDDSLGIETGIRKPLPGPAYSNQMNALAAAIFALDSGRFAGAIGATAVREAAQC